MKEITEEIPEQRLLNMVTTSDDVGEMQSHPLPIRCRNFRKPLTMCTGSLKCSLSDTTDSLPGFYLGAGRVLSLRLQ